MKKTHLNYLESKKELKKAEWELEKITAELVSHLVDNEGIEGIITWKREEKQSSKFVKETAKKLFPTLYSQFEGKPETIIWRVNIDDGKVLISLLTHQFLLNSKTSNLPPQEATTNHSNK